ncbi:MAG: hypothetical protein NTY77_14990 [Elusimicrobia bacterium]|nr:hypothetical protein [Elusimicrobiota bacterium]
MTAFLPIGLLAVLAACVQPNISYEPGPTAQNRLPIRAVVWLIKEQPPEPPTGRPATDAPMETSLTKNGSLWRPQLTMQVLSRALAAEIEARVAENAEVVECSYNNCPIVAEEQAGARLFVEGTVVEAVASRSRGGNQVYRLKIDLSATLVRQRQPNLQSYWTKTVEVEQGRAGRPAKDLAELMRKAFAPAADELARALEQSPAAEALAQAGQ